MSEAKSTTDGPTLEHKIFAEQVSALYAQAPGAFVLQLVLVSFIGFSTVSQVGERTAFFWCLFIVAFAVIDFFGHVAYKSKQEHYDAPGFWYVLFLVSTSIISAAWGIGGLYLITQLPLSYQMFIVVIMAVIAGAALPAVSTRVLPLILFVTWNLAPIAVWLLLSEETVHVLTATLLIPYGCALCFGGWQLNKQLVEALRYRFENEDLASSLKGANARLQSVNQELTQLSATDPLTQVANRRYFEERLEKEWKRLVREQGEISVIMIDVDHFKLFNDSLGHQQGDNCLTRVALCIRDSLRRPADMVARYGGEEFIVLLPNTTREGAVRVGEMIRENIINLEIAHPSSETMDCVTVSVGISYCQPDENTVKRSLIAKADEALYQSKEAGRNKVTVKVLES